MHASPQVAPLPPRPAAPQRSRAAGPVLVLDRDPDLACSVEPSNLPAAMAASAASVVQLAEGPWRWPGGDASGWLGLLVLDGLVGRRVTVAERTWTELLGAGDVLQPWRPAQVTMEPQPAPQRWKVLAPATLAVLDGAWAARMAAWPALYGVIAGRLMERIHSLTYTLAACGRVDVAERLLLVMRHYAGRWGRMTPEGVVVSLPGVTHELLAAQIGAARPSVSTALSELSRRGLVCRLDRQSWWVAPPTAQPAHGESRSA